MQCFNCQEVGHRAADCTRPRKEGKNDKTCFNCQKPGHLSRDCPEERKQRSNNYEGGQRDYGNSSYRDQGYKGSYNRAPEFKQDRPDDRKCYNCGESGHISRDCTEERKMRQNRFENDRPQQKRFEGNDSRPKTCFVCQQSGHFAKECTQEVTCFKCKKAGHKSYDCPTNSAH